MLQGCGGKWLRETNHLCLVSLVCFWRQWGRHFKDVHLAVHTNTFIKGRPSAHKFKGLSVTLSPIPIPTFKFLAFIFFEINLQLYDCSFPRNLDSSHALSNFEIPYLLSAPLLSDTILCFSQKASVRGFCFCCPSGSCNFFTFFSPLITSKLHLVSTPIF